jgi:hypothetical protein
MEYIYQNPDNRDDWKCVCGNDDGFYPCDAKTGNETEPDDSWDGTHYICVECGRIIDQHSLRVVNRVDVNEIVWVD